MFCENCGKEINNGAIVCPGCGCAIGSSPAASVVVEDKVNVGLCVLSAFIPLFGIIYWALKYKETPRCAKACGITAIVAWAVGVVLSFVLSFSMMFLLPILMASIGY